MADEFDFNPDFSDDEVTETAPAVYKAATVVTNGAANTQAVAIAPPTTLVVQVLDKLNFLLVLGEPSLFFSIIGCPF